MDSAPPVSLSSLSCNSCCCFCVSPLRFHRLFNYQLRWHNCPGRLGASRPSGSCVKGIDREFVRLGGARFAIFLAGNCVDQTKGCVFVVDSSILIALLFLIRIASPFRQQASSARLLRLGGLL